MGRSSPTYVIDAWWASPIKRPRPSTKAVTQPQASGDPTDPQNRLGLLSYKWHSFGKDEPERDVSIEDDEIRIDILEGKLTIAREKRDG